MNGCTKGTVFRTNLQLISSEILSGGQLRRMCKEPGQTVTKMHRTRRVCGRQQPREMRSNSGYNMVITLGVAGVLCESRERL